MEINLSFCRIFFLPPSPLPPPPPPPPPPPLFALPLQLRFFFLSPSLFRSTRGSVWRKDLRYFKKKLNEIQQLDDNLKRERGKVDPTRHFFCLVGPHQTCSRHVRPMRINVKLCHFFFSRTCETLIKQATVIRLRGKKNQNKVDTYGSQKQACKLRSQQLN